MININNNLNKEVTNNKGLTIVDFWAPWCGPCRMFSPVFEKIADNKKEIKFCKVNVDDNQDIAKELGVMSIPTIILFNDGKEIKRNIGFMDENSLIDFLEVK